MYLPLAKPKKWIILYSLYCQPSKTCISSLLTVYILCLRASKIELMNHWKCNTTAKKKNTAHTTEGPTWGYRVFYRLGTLWVVTHWASPLMQSLLSILRIEKLTSRHSSSSVVFIWAKLTVKFMCIVLEQIQDELWSVFYVLQKADSLEKLDIDS